MSLFCFPLVLEFILEMVSISLSCFPLILGICIRDGNYVSFLFFADLRNLY
jgi:hypothetical protein